MAGLKKLVTGVGAMLSTLVTGPKTPAAVAPPPPPPPPPVIAAPAPREPTPVPELPGRDNTATQAVRRRRTAAIQARGGRQSTILTGGMADVGSTDQLGG